MRGKKTAQLAYRLTDEEKTAISEIAEELRMKPAEIVSIVMAQFIAARQKHGKYLIWPPDFDYFTPVASKQEAARPSRNPVSSKSPTQKPHP